MFEFIFECDDYGHADWLKPSTVEDCLLEWITVFVKSLQTQNPKIGHAVIKRSGQGYHVAFPNTTVKTLEHLNRLLTLVPHDIGWQYWTTLHGRATLRISDKTIVVSNGKKKLGTKKTMDKPQPIRIIYPDGKTLYTDEIVRRFGNV